MTLPVGSGESRRSRERWLWQAVILAVLALPLLAAWCHQPDGAMVTGFLSDRDQDAWSYIAKMRQGYDGAWLFHNRYSDEPHSGAAGVFLYYLVLGHLARWSGVSLIVTYHLARLLCAALFVDGLDRLLAHLWPEKTNRRWAMAFVLFSGGLGWIPELNAIWGDARWWPGWLFPADLVWTGLTTIGSLLLYSHYPLALWLIVTCHRLAYEAEIAGNWPWSAAVAAFALAVHHPYDVVPVSVTLGLWFLWRSRRTGWSTILRLIPIATAVAVPVGYYAWLFGRHPMFARWAAQNICRSPHPAVYGLAFGGALLAAIPGLRRCDRESLWPLLGFWAVANGFLLYAPVSWQRLMMMGLPLVLMLWAGRGLLALGDRFPPQRRALLAGTLALLIPGPLLMLSVGLQSHSYLSAAELAAYRWLDTQRHDGRAVLAGVVTGNRAVALSGHPAVVGHWSETPAFPTILAEVQAWHDRNLPDAWLAHHHVGWVVRGPREQALYPRPPLAESPAYDRDGYAIWRIRDRPDRSE